MAILWYRFIPAHPSTYGRAATWLLFYLPTHRFPVIRPLVLSVHLYLHATIRLADLTPFSLTCICESSISPSSGHIFHTLSYLLFYCYTSRLSYCIFINTGTLESVVVQHHSSQLSSNPKHFMHKPQTPSCCVLPSNC